MATLTFDGTDDRIDIVTTAGLNAIPNGATTMVGLCARTGTGNDDAICGLREDSLAGESYHCLKFGDDTDAYDDDGITLMHFNTNCTHTGVTANDFFICGVDWPAGGAALERFHFSSKLSAAETWTHVNSDANNGGNQAGPGVGLGIFHIGIFGGDPFGGAIALVAVWNVRFTDTDFTNLWVNKMTSDWWNHPAGQPKTLIELTSTSPVDIGSDAASSITLFGPVATGNNPTGWTFNGRGGGAPVYNPRRQQHLRSR